MSLSPRKVALVGGLNPRGDWEFPTLRLCKADPDMYCRLTAQWQKPPTGPNWIEDIATGVMGLLPNGGIGPDYTLAVATRAPLLIRACGKRYVAHAGQHGTGCGKGTWRHTRNKLALPCFAMISQVSATQLTVAIFATTHAACQQYIHALSCTHVAVYEANVENSAFVAVGVVENVGFYVMGHPCRFETLNAARQFLNYKVPLRTCGHYYDRNGADVHGLDPVLHTTIGKCTERPRKTECKEWCAAWNPKAGKWFRKGLAPARVESVEIKVNRGVLSIFANLLCSEKPAQKSPTVFLSEFQDYAFGEERLCTEKNSPNCKPECRQSVSWDATRQIYRVQVAFYLTYKKAVRLHASTTFPYITCTLIFDNFGKQQSKLAIGGLCIGRYAHTDILHGVHLRAVPLSSTFLLVESFQLEAKTPELARILRSHTWLSPTADGQDRLLSLVRAEQCGSNMSAVGKLYPGEASVMLQALRSITAHSPIFCRKKLAVDLYPVVANVLPLSAKERLFLSEQPPETRLHQFLCVTLPSDLKL